MPAEKEVDDSQLIQNLNHVLEEISKNGAIYFVGVDNSRFVLGPSDMRCLMQGIVGQEHWWYPPLDVKQIKAVKDLQPSKQRIPSIFKDGKCCAIAIKLSDYNVIKTKIQKTKQPKNSKSTAETFLGGTTGGRVKTSGSWVEGQVVAGIYRILEEIGNGSFGTVYKVRHLLWQQDLAVKVPNKEMRSDSAAVALFYREAQTWTELGLHPNIVTCFYVRELNRVPRIFLEYVEGGNLRSRIGDLTLEQAIDFGIQICRGISYAHQEKLVHRDLKPENCLITKSGVLKVTDFGLVKLTDALNINGVAEGAAGTPEYMAPEQWGRSSQVTAKADIWALGVVLYEMCSGNQAFSILEGESIQAFHARLLQTNWSHAELPKKVPYKIVALIEQCLNIDVNQRPESILAIEEKLVDIYQKITNQPYYRKKIGEIALLATSQNNKGVSLIDLKKTKEALESFSAALKVDPSHPEAVYNQALLLWKNGEITDLEALDRVKAVSVNLPGVWKAHYLLGLIHIERQDAKAALCAIEEAERLNPRQPEVQTALGKLEEEGHNWIQSKGFFECGSKPVKSINVCSSILVGLADGKLGFLSRDDGSCKEKLIVNNGAILSTVFLEDFSYPALMVGSQDNNHITIWNPAENKCLGTLSSILGGKKLRTISFSLNGQNALTAFDQTAQYWDLDVNRKQMSLKRKLIGHTDDISSAVLCGEVIVTGSWDGTAKIWDVKNEKCKFTLQGHTKGVNAVALAKDVVLTGSLDQTAIVWDAESGKPIHALRGHSLSVDAVAVSSNGKLGLTASRDSTTRLWDLETGYCIRTLVGHKGGVTSVCFSSDNKLAVTGGNDGAAQLWSLGAYHYSEPIFVLGEIRSLEEEVKLRDEFDALADEIEELIWQEKWTSAAEALAKARNQPGYERHPKTLNFAVKIGQKGIINKCKAVWCSRDINVTGEKSAGIYAAFSLDGRFAVTSSGGLCEAFVWNLENKECIVLKGHTEEIYAVAFSASEMLALTSSADHTVKIWNAQTGKCLHTIKCPSSDVRLVAFSNDGKLAFAANADGSARIWDAKIGRLRSTLCGHQASIHSVAFSPDGRHILTGSADQKAMFWGVKSSKCLLVLSGHAGEVDAVAFSSDGRHALTGSTDCTARLWDLEFCKSTLLQGHSEPVRSVAFSPNNKQALTGSVDKTAILWNLETGNPIHFLKDHSALVSSVAFSPDGQMAITGSWDNTARIWSTKKRGCIIELTGHSGPVDLACFSLDSRYALTASYDKTLRVWECDWDYRLPDEAQWDEEAKPYLEIFLKNHTPYYEESFNPIGGPEYTQQDIEKLCHELSLRGFGWLKREGISKNLEDLAEETLRQQNKK